MFKIVFPLMWERVYSKMEDATSVQANPIKKWLQENREELSKTIDWTPMELLSLFNAYNHSTNSI